MALVLKDRVRESSTSTGTGVMALGGAPAGYQRFSSVMTIGDTCWYAIILPGSAWETGVGTYNNVNQLARTTVLESSNAGAAVSFAAGTKDVFICQPASKANVQNNTFPSGTLMLFQQTNAPVYWTKQVTHNDKALRVVSGAAGSGGSFAFSTVLVNAVAVSNTTIVTATMPSHQHSHNANINNSGASVAAGSNPVTSGGSATINANGGDGAHNHAFQLNVQYVDLIICSKD
jgi:hypothetical protein